MFYQKMIKPFTKNTFSCGLVNLRCIYVERKLKKYNFSMLVFYEIIFFHDHLAIAKNMDISTYRNKKIYRKNSVNMTTQTK